MFPEIGGDAFASDFSFGFDMDLSFDIMPDITTSPGEIDVTFPPITDVILSNAAPQPQDDSVISEQDTTVTVAVLENDSDPENNPIVLLAATHGANGQVAVNADGTVNYAPDAGFSGEDSFTYTVFDGFGFAEAMVTVTVTPTLDPNSIYVDTLDDVVDADDGFTSLREAVELANERDGADTIRIAVEGVMALEDGEFDIKDDVEILGNGVTVDAGGNSEIFDIDKEVSFGVENITLTNGYSKHGGAIHADKGVTLTLTDVNLIDNTAKDKGGAIAVHKDATVFMTGGVVSGNTAKKEGGAFDIDKDGFLSLTGTIVDGNSAKKGGAFAFDDDGSLTIEGGSLSNNSASDDGGAIYAKDDAFVFISGTSIENNIAGDDGGVLWLDDDADVFVSTPSNPFGGSNSAGDDGGFLAADKDMTATVNDVLFTGDDIVF